MFYRPSRHGARLAVACVLLLAGLVVGDTTSVQLAWNPSPDSVIIAYRLHWGTASGTYTATTNVGLATTATISGLDTNRTYWFAATAIASNQLESDFSNEVGWPHPLPPSIPSGPHVVLTPIVLRSIDGGAWQETNLWPTVVEATNSMELFQGLRVERKEFLESQ